MNRRGFFGLTAAAIGWLWGVKAEAKAPAALQSIQSDFCFTQHWEPFETISFSWITSEGSTGSATVDVPCGHGIEPGAALMVTISERQLTGTVLDVWRDKPPEQPLSLFNRMYWTDEYAGDAIIKAEDILNMKEEFTFNA